MKKIINDPCQIETLAGPLPMFFHVVDRWALFQKTLKLSKCVFTYLFKLWSYYATAAGKDAKDDKATISGDEFIGSMKKITGDKDHPEKLAGPLPLFFHAVDR